MLNSLSSLNHIIFTRGSASASASTRAQGFEKDPRFRADFVKAIKRKASCEIIPEWTPRYSHASLGIGEQQHQQVAGCFRALWASLEAKLGVRLPLTQQLVPWAIRHFAWTRMRERGGGDGATVSERPCETIDTSQ